MIVKDNPIFTGIKRKKDIEKICACGCDGTFITKFKHQRFKDNHRKKDWARKNRK